LPGKRDKIVGIEIKILRSQLPIIVVNIGCPIFKMGQLFSLLTRQGLTRKLVLKFSFIIA
jgi:hypothetical protein